MSWVSIISLVMVYYALLQRTPGPGSYAKMSQTPMPPHIRQLGRYHGLFFPPGVY